MADRRTYVRLHDGLPDHMKIAAVGGEAAWLYVCGLCYASRQLTDGVIPVRLVGRMTDLSNNEALASRLLEANLWHTAQHECKSCPQAVGDVYVIHDYLEHQRSADEVRELSEKRSAAGRKGGRASGVTRKGEANSEASAQAKSKQTRSKTEAETETDKKKTTSSSRAERGTRISDDFTVTTDMVAWLRGRYPHVNGPLETEKFINYWRAKTGRDATKSDWPATWRNWMINAAERAAPQIPGTATTPARPDVPWCGHCDRLTREVENDRDQLVPCPTCSPKRRNP